MWFCEVLSANPHITETACVTTAVLAAAQVGWEREGSSRSPASGEAWMVSSMTLGRALPPVALFTQKQPVPASKSGR